ncbi:hypothetical protein PAECIP111893_02588 [Paenibacillus plantiphilus]|uniref:Uncharacterized protein n=1 Tax=Paenibacillus plantiphilus TaxID=2905650 RepID=A0ABM9C9U0_9BACL|nr:hypothetical protein PAECIP111893_02588 [Paenibacillus plantiphilus]
MAVKGGRQVRSPFLCHKQGRPTIRQHLLNPHRRVSRIDSHKRTAGLQNAQHPDSHVHRTLHHQANDLIRSHALRSKRMRQPVRPRIQLRIRQTLRFMHNGDMIRRLPHLLLEQAVDRPIRRIRCSRIVEALQQLGFLRFIQQLDVRQLHVRVRRQLLQQTNEMTRKPLHRLLLIQRCAVFQREVQPCRSLFRRQRKVEFRNPVPRSVRAQPQSFQLRLSALQVLQHEHRIEQRVPAHIPRHIQLLHQFLKRIILMCERLQHLLFHFLHERREPLLS